MSKQNYTLLVDESGIDKISKRVLYVGCLFPSSEIEKIKEKILQFHQKCLDDIRYSGKPNLVNSSNEPRHFVDDNESLRVKFIDEIIRTLPCRVYAVFDTPKETVRDSKVRLFKRFIRFVQEVREIDELKVIIEKSGADDKYLEECGAEFKTKEFLPLSVVDYYGAILHKFHEARIKIISNNEPLKKRDLNRLEFIHYLTLIDHISFEYDLSTGEKSTRRDGRYFLKQINSIVKED